MKCVSACLFPFVSPLPSSPPLSSPLLFSSLPPRIKCLLALTAGGKTDIKIGLLKVSQSRLSPYP